jgi:putative SOS response-associated peptidase YedK
MCNLYSMTRAPEAVRRLFGVAHNRAATSEPRDAIFPSHVAPVVRPAADGERELVTMSWGFVLPQPGKAPRRVTNTRDDKVLSSRFWTPSFKARRCLVPATSFCEPHGSRTPATWHWFALADAEDPRPLFAFAGLWQRHRGPVKKDGPAVEIDVFSFMTSEPNALTSRINHERSPVLLTTPEEWATWTTGTPEEAFALVRPIAPERLRIVQEGFEKRDLLSAVAP